MRRTGSVQSAGALLFSSHASGAILLRRRQTHLTRFRKTET